ncbi:E3 ubiquitin-protein ligase XIAP-like [Anoplolepis gracilipes]|uniref:E3 ubiquitin-protein ligase XIAP-like n=1 Tax=Anoplolepis gracilipes TaxID=354296 RepID=UPI003BA32F6F
MLIVFLIFPSHCKELQLAILGSSAKPPVLDQVGIANKNILVDDYNDWLEWRRSNVPELYERIISRGNILDKLIYIEYLRIYLFSMKLTVSSQISFEILSVDEPDRTDYRFEIARLNSYANWTVSTVNSKYHESLVRAGLYYTGEGDKVKCFECHAVMSDWRDDMDPWVKHTRRSPRCRFIRKKPCGNVPIGVDPDLIPARVPKVEEICSLNLSNVNQVIEVYFEMADVIERVQIGDLIGAQEPQFASYTCRLNSYISWPASQKKEDMAAAGFVCMNDADAVYCFYCNGGLRVWGREEDPKQEHVKWFPNCKFIKKLLADE